MSQTIKIKRTTGTGKDTSVEQGELFMRMGTTEPMESVLQ